MAKKERIIEPKAQRAVNWAEKAIQAVIDKVGYVLVGIKIDGFRCHVFQHEGKTVITTREGIEIIALKEYAERLGHHWRRGTFHKDVVLDCEVWLPGVPFQEMSGHLRREAPLPDDIKPQFVVLDIFPKWHLLAEARPEMLPPYHARVSAIVSRFGVAFGNPTFPVVSEALARCTSIDQIREVYAEARSRGHEGVVVKDPSAPPRNGKVAGQWKLKPGCGAPGWEGDGKIIGYVWGEEGKANDGKIVGFRVALEGGGESNATGLTKAQIAEYTDAYWDDQQRRPVFEWSDTHPGPYIGRYCQVEAMEMTDGGSLRHPRFIAFRDMDYAPGIKA